MTNPTPAAAEPSITEDQIADLADKLYARLWAQLALGGHLQTQPNLHLNEVDVEGLLSCSASEQVGNVVPALFEARKEFAKLTKNRENPHFGSSYADLAQVLAVTEEGLAKHGLALVQNAIYLKWAGQLEMFLQTRIWHVTSLEWLQAWWWVDPVKRDPQGFGSAITYGRRYPAQTLLGLAGEDDDGNSAAQNSAAQAGAAPRRGRAEPPPEPTVGPDELTEIRETTAALESVDAVREYWTALGKQNMLSTEVKTLLNARVTELGAAAKPPPAKKAAKKAPPGPPPAETPDSGEQEPPEGNG